MQIFLSLLIVNFKSSASFLLIVTNILNGTISPTLSYPLIFCVLNDIVGAFKSDIKILSTTSIGVPFLLSSV